MEAQTGSVAVILVELAKSGIPEDAGTPAATPAERSDRRPGRAWGRYGGWLALGLLLSPLAQAQFTCDGTFYQVKEPTGATASSLFRINRGSNPYTATALYTLPGVFNNLGYNPVDNYQYALNVAGGPPVMYRLGPAGVIPLGTAGPGGTGVAIANMPASTVGGGYVAATIDKQGTYFVSQPLSTGVSVAGTWPIVVVNGLAAGTPTAIQIATANILADPSPPAGYTGTTLYSWGDIAVNPTESTSTLTVFYGVANTTNEGTKIYRAAISNPASATPTARVSSIPIVNYPAGFTFGSNFFDASGALYEYSGASTATQGFFIFNTSTGVVTNVSGAASAPVSDGASCAFAPAHIDVVKQAGTVTSSNGTTFDVPYTLVVGNTDPTVSDPNVQISDDLKLSFSSGAPALSITTPVSVASGICTANAAFDGTANFNLLAGTDTLAPGQQCTVTFTVRVSYPNLTAVPSAPQQNTAYASATAANAGTNQGYTFPGGQPVPPIDLLAVDQSTSGPRLPATPNGDTPTPTPVQLPVPPRVQIAKSANTTGALTPGGTVTYTVVATNTGTSSAAGTLIGDPLPAGIASATWSCIASNAAVCPAANGSGALNQTVATFPAGGVLTYTIIATVSTTPPAAIANMATANPPNGLCAPGDTAPPCTITVSNPTAPIVQIAKQANKNLLTPGGGVSYTVTVTNTGAVDASGTTVSDPLPAGLASASWTCTASAGATCAPANGTGAVTSTLIAFPAGSSAVYTVVGVVAAKPPASVVNNATATPPAGGVCTGGTAAPCMVTVGTPSAPQVGISKSTTASVLSPNGTVTYVVTASNGGSVAASGTTISDPLPAGIASATWVCVASGGAACPTVNGSGAIIQTLASFPAGGTLTYTVTATIAATPPAQVSNVATLTPPAGGVCLPANTAPPCVATVNEPTAPIVSISKKASTSTVAPNGSITYTVIASNTGSVSAAGTVVSDPLPAGIASATWSCIASGGAVCPNASGSGALNETVATFPVAGVLTYSVVATISSAPPAQISNTASLIPPSGGVCANGQAVPCTATTTSASIPVVSIGKTTAATSVTPNGMISYMITANNSGSADAAGSTLVDPLPAGIVSATWTCTSSGGAICPAANGSGAINQTVATFPAGSSLVYAFSATVSASPPASVINTATLTPPGGGECPNGQAAPCTATVSVPPVPVVSLSKTTSTSTATRNGTILYTVTASNTSNVSADGTNVSDPLPAGVASATWTCTGAGGAVCPNANGTGAINETIATFPAGGSVIYALSAIVAAAPPANVANTAGATPPGGGLCSNGQAAPCTATVNVPVDSGSITPQPDSSTTPFQTPVTINVTTNDNTSGASINPASVVPTPPAHGSVACDPSGNCTYTPAPGFSGTDTYTYQVCDSTQPTPNCGSTTVSIVVGPQANDDTSSTTMNTPVTGNVSGNDVDPPGSTFAPATNPAHGTLAMNPDGSYTYTPATGYTGTDSFTYSVCEPAPNQSLCSIATVTISVAPTGSGNSTITLLPDSGTTPYATPVAINVLGNDTTSGPALDLASLTPTQPAHGSVTCNNSGVCTYTPAPGFTGNDGYTYIVCDTTSPLPNCASTSVSIVVGPQANNDGATTPVDVPVSGNAAANDIHPAGSTFTATSTPAHGSVTMQPDGSYTYTPAAGFTGNDGFTYTVCEAAPNQTLCSTATVTITIGLPPGPVNVPMNAPWTLWVLGLSLCAVLAGSSRGGLRKKHLRKLSWRAFQRPANVYRAGIATQAG
jgi:uncharacterized repeat protein (TIGR01451 family)